MDTLDILDVKEAEQWVFWKTEKGIEQTKKLQDRDVESMLQIILQPIVSMTGCHSR